MSRISIRLSFVFLLFIYATQSVLAHDAVLLRSQPVAEAKLDESPEEITVWFGEELVSQGSHLTLFNSQGKVVQRGGLDLHDPDHASMNLPVSLLADGIYTVYWQVALLDGDETDGTIIFTVGQPDSGETAFEPTAVSSTNRSARTAVFIVIAVVIIGSSILFWRRRTTN